MVADLWIGFAHIMAQTLMRCLPLMALLCHSFPRKHTGLEQAPNDVAINLHFYTSPLHHQTAVC